VRGSDATTYRAVLIANSIYPVAPHDLAELEGPRNDPAILRDALCEDGVGLFPSDNVRLVTERTAAEVQLEIEDLLQSATSRDTVLLYFSGHGRLDLRNELYLCARDTRPDRLRATAVSASWISEAIEDSAAGVTVVMLDCCHSGAFKGGEVGTSLGGDGRFVLASNRGSELAQDTDVHNRASVFTAALVEGLRAGAEDGDGDGRVSLSELYHYVHARLTSAGKQTPVKRFSGTGDVPIALRAHSSRLTDTQGLIQPSVARPELDVFPSEIDLGEVEPEEELPPERVTVVNRGGGSLEWRVETSDPWVRAVITDFGAELRLCPPAGATRANVWFRDLATGAVTTVRVKVRTRAEPRASQEPARSGAAQERMSASSSQPNRPPDPPITDTSPVSRSDKTPDVLYSADRSQNVAADSLLRKTDDPRRLGRSEEDDQVVPRSGDDTAPQGGPSAEPAIAMPQSGAEPISERSLAGVHRGEDSGAERQPTELTGRRTVSTDSATIVVRRPPVVSNAYAIRKYSIEVDGTVRGKVALDSELKIDVLPGRHIVRAKVDWYSSIDVPIDLIPGEQVILTVEPSNASQKSQLALSTIGALRSPKSYLKLTREP